MLSVANIQSGRRVMVFDDCMGIVVGSIMERLGGYGLVFAVNKHENKIPAYDCVNRLNFNVIADENTYVVDHEGSHSEEMDLKEDRPLTLADYQSNIRNTLLIWHISDLLKIQPYSSLVSPLSFRPSLATALRGSGVAAAATRAVTAHHLRPCAASSHHDGSPDGPQGRNAAGRR